MIDYRYHALSLAAVLFALALGVVIGVAIGDSNLVSSAKNGIVHNLESEVGEAHRQSGVLQAKLGQEEAFANGLYPLATHELLNGRAIGLVFLGGSSDQVDSLVRSAVAQAGGNLATVVALRDPLDIPSIDHEAAGTHYSPLTGTPLIERFGELIGRQLVSGGPLADRELISRVRAGLMSAFDGQLTRLEGLVRDARRTERHEPRTERSRGRLRVRPAGRRGRRRRACGGSRAEQHRTVAGQLVLRQEPVERR